MPRRSRLPQVWRQLWRVLERSDVVCQIVDARQPLFYFSNDLDSYAAELPPKGESGAAGTAADNKGGDDGANDGSDDDAPRVGDAAAADDEEDDEEDGDARSSGAPVDVVRARVVVMNKADLLSRPQRRAWARHFEAQDRHVLFFSAHAAQVAVDRVADKAARARAGYAAKADNADDADDEVVIDDNEGDDEGRVLSRDELLRALVGLAPASAIAATAAAEAAAARGAALATDPDAIDDDEAEAAAAAAAGEVFEVGGGDDGADRRRACARWAARKRAREAHRLTTAAAARAARGVVIGMVGFPNVGKSSVINALSEASARDHGHGNTRVGTGATPGKTKHFQTVELGEVRSAFVEMACRIRIPSLTNELQVTVAR